MWATQQAFPQPLFAYDCPHKGMAKLDKREKQITFEKNV